MSSVGRVKELFLTFDGRDGFDGRTGGTAVSTEIPTTMLAAAGRCRSNVDAKRCPSNAVAGRTQRVALENGERERRRERE
ncbi:hypothetical protein [Halobiforma nitratireducens]|uniref:Uncharacterized protein n=1 Tax=Halobiforma nitratireducens JCM 10879 TaxID=1227454 RepID=M0M007_9EURY|nr:hypothetical protein [Halobiforma nitratireducens]EMA39142.1 hypothetical protein C446_08958 [Halobiforma nitratireducens JCM 10879]